MYQLWILVFLSYTVGSVGEAKDCKNFPFVSFSIHIPGLALASLSTLCLHFPTVPSPNYIIHKTWTAVQSWKGWSSKMEYMVVRTCYIFYAIRPVCLGVIPTPCMHVNASKYMLLRPNQSILTGVHVTLDDAIYIINNKDGDKDPLKRMHGVVCLQNISED